MILGIMGDTHKDIANIIHLIVEAFIRAGVEIIIHTGDIETKHLNAELFGNIPVICALTNGQEKELDFQFPPHGWVFTYPGNRVKVFKNFSIYVGHKKLYELLRKKESEFRESLEILGRDYDGIRWLFAGHVHRQIFDQDPLINCVNPGAVEGASWGYEYAIVKTKKREVTFSRILPTQPTIEKFKIAVISDSRNVSQLNPPFWEKLAERLKQEGVQEIIHCGNLVTEDIGIEALKDFKVHYTLHEGQANSRKPHDNWQIIRPNNPIVDINGYRFCVQHGLGGSLISKSEIDMLKLSLELAQKYPSIDYVLFGLTRAAFLEENEQLWILNPGDIINDQNFATIELPQNEITFGRIPFDPLPVL
ncbi:metallophosphoesterase family protein [Patescibacteria group bacterium]|nr:metallophosphoesterase family protein [Patescibacteria group bacterium]